MQIQKINGHFNGTGAACYLCVGAVPNKVVLTNTEVATYPTTVEWHRDFMCEVSAYGGLLGTGASTGQITTKLTTTGIAPYEGGDLLTTANQTSTAYGEGIYLGWDLKDYRADTTYGCVSSTPINKWTFETGLTGHFNTNGVASGCRIGLGSIIRIKEYSSGLVKEAAIVTLTSTPDFTTSTYVGLTRAIGTGDIVFIGGMYSLAPIPLGKVTPAGVKLLGETVCNVNDNMVMFEMESYLA